MIRALEVAFNNLQYQRRFSEAVEQLYQATTLPSRSSDPPLARFSWGSPTCSRLPIPIPDTLAMSELSRSRRHNRESQAITLGPSPPGAYAESASKAQHFTRQRHLRCLGRAVSHGAASSQLRPAMPSYRREPSRVVFCRAGAVHPRAHTSSSASARRSQRSSCSRSSLTSKPMHSATSHRTYPVLACISPSPSCDLFRVATRAITLPAVVPSLLSDFIVSLQLAHLRSPALRMPPQRARRRATPSSTVNPNLHPRTIAAYLYVVGSRI